VQNLNAPKSGRAHPTVAQIDVFLVTRYGLFALLAMLVNLATQAVTTALTLGSLSWPIAAGTVSGFATKYFLDKYWIFFDCFSGRANEFRKIVVYGLFSMFTTALFWATEISFWMLWHTDLAKYFGAAIGLSSGYWLKYRLDRDYTFRRRIS
jgi:putative flippase GtrA